MHDKTLKHFRKTLRVKPSASRQTSQEIYYLCLDYDNSLDEEVIRAKELKKRFDKIESKMRQAEDGEKKMSPADQAESQELYD